MSLIYFRKDFRSMSVGPVLTLLLAGAAILLFMAAGSRAASPGALDLSFGTRGTAGYGPHSQFEQAEAIAVQPDGKIVEAGWVVSCVVATCSSDFLLVRYNANGTPDTEFGTTGRVITDHFGQDEAVFAMAVQADGKIVVAGGYHNTGSAADYFGFKIFRYMPDGDLDTTFGNAGRVYESFGNLGGTPRSIAFQPDGKIVVAGSDVNSMLFVLRLETNGALDASFGTNGIIASSAYGVQDVRIALDASGKLLIAGRGSSAANVKVIRLTAGGTPDSGFGTGGVVTATFAGVVKPVLAVQPDGKIILSGSYTLTNEALPPLVRLNADGGVDGSFTASHGAENVGSCMRCTQKVTKIMLLPDGRFYLSGTFRAHGTVQLAISRYLSNGTIDRSFAYAGTGLPRLSNSTAYTYIQEITDAALALDGEIVIMANDNSSRNFYVSRLHSHVTPPSVRGDFDGDGITDAAVFRPSNSYWYVLNSGNGSFLATYFGLAADTLLPGDYNYDLKTDYSVARSSDSIWYTTPAATSGGGVFGQPGDLRISEDFDGDGYADRFGFRPDGTWLIRYSGKPIVHPDNDHDLFFAWGVGTDIPVPADYDGDGRADIAVYRPSNGIWYILRSSDLQASYFQFGAAGDKTVQADYDGDLKADVALFRDGVWYIWRSSDGVINGYTWGFADDKPVPGDYDGDGKFDIAVFRPSTGIWYILKSSDGGFMAKYWGIAEDRPIPNAFVR